MSTEKEYTRFITDPVMEPYFISMDDNCMTVNVKVIPDARYTDSGKEYDFEHIVPEGGNLGICGGRQFIAEHFDKTDLDYMH